MASFCMKLLLIFLSLILPPLAVWIARNKICSGMVFLNIILTLLGIVCIWMALEHLSTSSFLFEDSWNYSCMVCYLLLQ